MAKNKKKKGNTNLHYEDYEDMRGKGVKRERKKAQRHNDKNTLKNIQHGDMLDYDELEYYMDDLDWRSNT